MSEARPGSGQAAQGVQPVRAHPAAAGETIELAAETDPSKNANKIRAFGIAGATNTSADWKRTAHVNKTGAVRVRSFHGRLSDQGMEYLDHSVNEWLDKNPDIEVKFVTSNVGLFEGKLKEPALILNIWY
jgi:ABC-type glycerol-3-phosphate transport system substrate-binding protein